MRPSPLTRWNLNYDLALSEVTVMDDVIGLVQDWELDQLEELRSRVGDLIDGKRLAKDAPRQMDWLIEEYQSAIGRRHGDQWVAPVDPLCAYPRDSTATHGGVLYKSVTHFNMTEPGVSDSWVPADGGNDAA